MNHETGKTHEEGMRERLRLAPDAYRPAYHYLPPSNWMNDPNGTFFWQGRYHLFYQYNPHEAHHGGRTGTIHWGHTVSENLVDWEDLPIALTPTPDGPDMDGCFSGTAFVGPDGVPTIIYHGVPGGICLATSTDDMLVHWEKHPANPVILTPGPDDPYKVDGAPCGWVEGDTCYAITGNSSHDAFDGREPDRAYLFKSDDMAHWEYMHPFYEGGVYTERGEDCAVPDFFPLGDKHVLLFASHRRGPHYYVGSYADNKFIPEHHRRLAFGETNFTARTGILNECQTLLDDNDRRILFSRISEARYGCVQRDSGWAGIMALPSVLSLAADNHLLVEPVPELESLRGEHQHIADLAIAPDSIVPLDPVAGNRLEIRAGFARRRGTDANSFQRQSEPLLPPGDTTVAGARPRCYPLQHQAGYKQSRIAALPRCPRRRGTRRTAGLHRSQRRRSVRQRRPLLSGQAHLSGAAGQRRGTGFCKGRQGDAAVSGRVADEGDLAAGREWVK